MVATRSYFKLLLSLLLGTLLLVGLLKPAQGASISQPTSGSASQDTRTASNGGPALGLSFALGITPTATPSTSDPTPTPANPTATPKPDGGGNKETEEHYVEVALDCNLVCSIDGPALTVRANVRLVHQGSGWISELTISNQGSTRVKVPYGGQWEVWLIDQPEVSPLDGLDPSTITYPSDLPKLLGVVNADSGTQLVDCPVSCPAPVPPPVEEEAPPILPQTGFGLSMESLTTLGILALIVALVVGGFVSVNRSIHLPFTRGRYRSDDQHHPE